MATPSRMRSGVRVTKDMRDIDSIRAVARGGLLPENVLADAGNECNRSSGAGGGHRLIGSLAARHTGERATQNGFTRFRNARHLDDHVRVGATGNDHGTATKSWRGGRKIPGAVSGHKVVS